MNVSDDPITLYPRTKLGTFTLIEPRALVPFTTIDITEHEARVSQVKTSAENNQDQSDKSGAKEILSKVKLNADYMSEAEMAEITRLIVDYSDIFQVENGPRG